MIRFIERRGIAYAFSAVLMAGSIVALSLWGLKFGIDFTGGSLLEVKFSEARPSVDDMQGVLASLELGGVAIQPTGETGVILRFKHVDEITHQTIVRQLGEAGQPRPDELRFESIGPTIGKELQRQALIAISVALFLIISYIAWAFRKVSYPVASWKYGLTAIIALAHNTLITIGVFSVMGRYFGTEVDSLFVSALLTLLGFSVHDTIVVYDRTRENIFKHSVESFAETVNKSLNDTLVRSVNTGMCTLLVLVALFLFGGDTIKNFSLALIIGISIGTYSSIFVASPLLVDWYRLSSAKTNQRKK